MSLSSPWARDFAVRLQRLGHAIHAVDYEKPWRQDLAYLTKEDSFQHDSIAHFRSEIAGVHFLRSRFTSAVRHFATVPMLQRILDEQRVEVVLSLYGGGYALLASSSRRPYAVYLVGSDVLSLGMGRRMLTRAVLRGAGAVFANGFYLAGAAQRVTDKPVIPLYLGLDVSKFTVGTPPLQPIKMVCTRGFMSIYNNEAIIEALSLVSMKDRDYRATFVSAGPTLNDVRGLANQILTPEKRERLTFLGGATDTELRSQLTTSHVFVSMSRSDGTSTSLLEALACGLFPVVSDLPQNREWIRHGSNGLLVRLDQPRLLAEGLERAMMDDELRRRAAIENRRLVQDRADMTKSAAEVDAHLRHIVAERN